MGHCGVRSPLVRIAHVSDCFAPRTGGIETQVAALAGQQAAAGDDVRVITATPGHGEVFAGDEVVDGLTVHRVAAHLPFELPVHPRTGREVERVLAEHPVDVVHVHAGVVSPFAWGAIRAATKAGIPTLVTVHSVWGPLARPGFGVIRRPAALVVVGRHAECRQWVAAARIQLPFPGPARCSSSPNGIDPALWQVAHLPAGATALRLTSVMRMAPRKRTLPLVHDHRVGRASTRRRQRDGGAGGRRTGAVRRGAVRARPRPRAGASRSPVDCLGPASWRSSRARTCTCSRRSRSRLGWRRWRPARPDCRSWRARRRAPRSSSTTVSRDCSPTTIAGMARCDRPARPRSAPA